MFCIYQVVALSLSSILCTSIETVPFELFTTNNQEKLGHMAVPAKNTMHPRHHMFADGYLQELEISTGTGKKLY